MLSEAQLNNYKFFTSHLQEYLDDPLMKNKYVIISGEKVVGAYDSFGLAYKEACDNYALGEFIIQQVVDTSEIVEFLWSAVV